jgi:hypothetical protein
MNKKPIPFRPRPTLMTPTLYYLKIYPALPHPEKGWTFDASVNSSPMNYQDATASKHGLEQDSPDHPGCKVEMHVADDAFIQAHLDDIAAANKWYEKNRVKLILEGKV